jgi:hypothetical protein
VTTSSETAAEPITPGLASRREALRAEEKRTRFWRVTIVTVFFVVVMGANLFVGAVLVFGTVKTQSETAALEAAHRTGRVSRSMLDGMFCRFTTYDNQLGQVTEDRIARCEDVGGPRRQNRNTFNWGKE